MISFTGASPARDLAFRLAAGSFDLPADASAQGLSCVLETAQGLQALLELYDASGGLRLQVVRYRGGRSPTARIAEDFRGTSLNARHGPLGAGPWTYRLAVRNVSSLGGEGPRALPWSVELETSPGGGVRAADTYPDGASLDACGTGAGEERGRTVTWGGCSWYPGDAHQHTSLSDGRSDPDRLIRENRLYGHAFLSITDHQLLAPPRSFPDLAVLGGTEVTTPNGHFLRLGALPHGGLLPDAPGATFGECDDLPFLCSALRRDGGLLVACHPRFPPWHWRCEPFSAFPFDAMEILCDPNHPGAAAAADEALALWNGLLGQGRRIVGLGGSDYHGDSGEGTKHAGSGRPGDPTTFLGSAEPPTGEGLLDSIRTGRVAVGRGFFPGLEVAWAGKTCLPGDTMEIPRDPSGPGPTFRIAVIPRSDGLPTLQATIVGSGDPEDRFPLVPGRPIERRLRWPDRKEGWFRLDLRDPSGGLAGFTNPIRWVRTDPMDHEAGREDGRR